MASIKIAVTELSAKKATYTKAARNLRDIIQTLNKARTSIGNDRMFDRAKQSIKKLVDLLDRRAFELEALAQVMGTSADSYNNAQSHVVSVVSDYKAHKQDFYGNPVHVSGAAGGASGAAAAATTASAPSGSSSYAGGSSSAGSGSSGTSYTTNTSSTASTGSAGGAAGESPVVNNYSETTVNNYTQNNIYVSSSDAVGAAGAAVAAAPAAAGVVETSAASVASAAPAAAGVAAEAASSGGGLGAAAIGIGIGAAATAAGIGAAGIISSKKKEKKEKGVSSENSEIDKKLAEARKKLSALENEEEVLKANLTEVTE